MSDDLTALTACKAAEAVANGDLTSEALVRACLERIEALEPEVGAWSFLDGDSALSAARQADNERRSGRGVGVLHGVPIGVKDIFDTADMPTENGTPVHAGRQPDRDAAAVRALRDAGMIMLGKTVTTELATFHPGKTRNPLNTAHSPGGSSSGSAASVAANMLPAAIGSQTAGSTIRPASFCGVFGFKPSFGLISRTGCLKLSRALDTVGLFARSLGDIAVMTECMTASDPDDPDCKPRSRAPLARIASEEPPLPPLFAFVPTSKWPEADDTTHEAFAELVDHLGERCDRVELPDVFDRAWDWHHTLMCADVAQSVGPMFQSDPTLASAELTDLIETGRGVSATRYQEALNMRSVIAAGLSEVFERYDAILTPAAPGPAPKGIESTGSPVFNVLWTYAGVPCVSLPLLEDHGLPIGAQLVGPAGDDGRLLRTAQWLCRAVS